MTEVELEVARVLDGLCKGSQFRAVGPATRIAFEYIHDSIGVFDRMVEEQNEEQNKAA